MPFSFPTKLLFAVWMTACTVSVAFPAEPAERAEEVLEAAKVTGGWIVHLGCGDGTMTAELSQDGRFLVQGLTTDPEVVRKARETVQKAGVYGRVTIRRLGADRLPYVHHVVNLLIDETGGAVAEKELMRVLAPGGVLLRREGESWNKKIKPPREGTDSWTHFLYDASNNAVSHDQVVGPPESLRWTCDPEYARSHEHLGSVSAMVSDHGRVFYIVDEGPIADVTAPPEWKLVARDAHNGVLLWSRPIDLWESPLRGFRSGPVDIARRLTVHGDRLYGALPMGAEVQVWNAATGELVRTLEDSHGAREILIDRGQVFVVADDMSAEGHRRRKQWFEERAETMTHYEYPRVPIREFGARRLLAYSQESGELQWKKSDEETVAMLPAVTAVYGDAVCLHTPAELICLDRATGEKRWQTPRPLPLSRVTWSTPTLVIADGVVLVADRADLSHVANEAEPGDWIVENSHKGRALPAEIVAYDLSDGRELWRGECFENYDCPLDVFVIDQVVWTGKILGKRDPGFVRGRDLHTGKVVAQMQSDLDYFQPGMGHHRCYRNKATVNYILTGRSGIEFIDPVSGAKIPHHWVRGTCQYGVMPTNGLVIAPLHSCACHITGKLTGINALAPESAYPVEPPPPEARLEKGAAYAMASEPGNPGDWPLYRRDARRSGATEVSLSPPLEEKWLRNVGSSITPPIVAGGKVFCVDQPAHSVAALRASDGRPEWRFVARGPIDSPPAFSQGRLVFGARSGDVYCLDADSGKLAWRFQAAPTEAQIVSEEQLESLWPVHGSVLVQDDRVYFAAGRSSFLDGGILLYALDLKTGRQLASRKFSSRDPQTGEQPKDLVRSFGYDAPRVALPDILTLEDGDLFMRHLRFDADLESLPLGKKHLYSSAGLLDENWWHRTYWQFGESMGTGYHGWHLSGNRTPAGRMIVLGDRHVFGYGRKFYDKRQGGHPSAAGPGHHLFREPMESSSRKGEKKSSFTRSFKWSLDPTDPVVAMALTQDLLFVATVPKPWMETTQGAKLHAVGRESGEVIWSKPLAAVPVFDAMAVTDRGLFLAFRDGRVGYFASGGVHSP